MLFRALLPEIFGTPRLQLANVLAKEQAFRFKVQFRNRILCVRTFGSKNLNVFKNSWKQRLKENNIPEENLTVKFIIEHVLGKKRTWSWKVDDNVCVITEEEEEKLEHLFQQRLKRVPLQYVIGEWDFRNLTLEMRPPVFIPRPETEELVELVSRHHCLWSGGNENFSFLEVGCGSGAICLSILTEFPQANSYCVAIDKSKDAIDLTRDNAKKCRVCDRISLVHTDVRSVLPKLGPTKFDAVISNPPYVLEDDMLQLQPEISKYEDVEALCGGRDGLDVIKEILRLSAKILKPNGSVWLEVDSSHPDSVNQWILSQDLGLKYCATFNDFANWPRFCHIIRQ
ncbi:MTRF1L release factor glutamine methyltransferase-like isoform X1 [Acropora millepora]|uniref:MTRF1L release factor glutamine methyltransferase-like isoform X1 n=2 Tax=Acropora millepora TaxID=45264 RepID=UPI001CF22B14|nr:MTRF1L release factor glutamine methyltransferase-like isoform X1 [Acropora millepora]